MAEVLGVARSVISVASFAVQLAESVQKVCEFWDSIEDGPDDIRRISAELRWLANYLSILRHEHSCGLIEKEQEPLVRGALEIAKKDIDELAGLVTELSRGMGSDQGRMKRKWGKIQVVLKAGKINKMNAHIESIKSILSLLQASRTR
jgi:hypothetical protein